MERLISVDARLVFHHKLCNVRRFVDDLFVSDIPFQEFKHKSASFVGGGIYSKEFCELNCTSNSSFFGS